MTSYKKLLPAKPTLSILSNLSKVVPEYHLPLSTVEPDVFAFLSLPEQAHEYFSPLSLAVEPDLLTFISFPKPMFEYDFPLRMQVTELVTDAVISEFGQRPITHLNAFHRYAIINKYESILSTINSYRVLEAGWDGENSVPPTETTVEYAKVLIDHLPPGVPYPNPMLNPSGEVGFFWDNSSGYIDIEIEPEGHITVYSREKTGALKEDFQEFDIQQFQDEPNQSPILPTLNLIK